MDRVEWDGMETSGRDTGWLIGKEGLDLLDNGVLVCWGGRFNG